MMISIKQLSVLLAAAVSASAAAVLDIEQRNYPTSSCAAENCFARAIIPPKLVPKVEDFCYQYLHSKRPTSTVTATAKATVTKPLTATNTATATSLATAVNTQSITVTTTSTFVLQTVCGSTSTVTALQTVVAYSVRGQAPGQINKRAPAAEVAALAAAPVEILSGCRPESLAAKVSAACSCFLKKAKAKTTTVTTTQTATATSLTTVAVTATALQTTQVTTSLTVTTTIVVTSVSCTQTSTATAYDFTSYTCGIANPQAGTSGTVTCPNVATPSQTNARFRIEGGGEGTVFEDCIVSGPRQITTPSGGTHLCDSTNNGANSSPGANLITELDQASKQVGFTYDGTYSTQFDDFYIQSISATSATASQFWGILLDLQFTPAGGCETKTPNGPEGLWAFNAFSVNGFLKLSPGYQVVRAGDTASVTLTVTASDGEGNTSPAAGASVNGQTSDANGNLQLTVPDTPGCYQFKAEKSGNIRSNAFYLTVLPAA